MILSMEPSCTTLCRVWSLNSDDIHGRAQVLKMAKSSPNAARNPPQSCPFELKLSGLEVHTSTATWPSMSENDSFSVKKSWIFDFANNLCFGFLRFTKEKSFHLKEFSKNGRAMHRKIKIWITSQNFKFCAKIKEPQTFSGDRKLKTIKEPHRDLRFWTLKGGFILNTPVLDFNLEFALILRWWANGSSGRLYGVGELVSSFSCSQWLLLGLFSNHSSRDTKSALQHLGYKRFFEVVASHCDLHRFGQGRLARCCLHEMLCFLIRLYPVAWKAKG